MQTYRILVVEDDDTICNLICSHLLAWGYETERVTDFQNVTTLVASYRPHLILLDIMLPFYNGFHWCGEIRKISVAPIVFLSSASDNMNIVMAMNMGGDDFIAKPFDQNVLTAKLQAILRRTYAFAGQVSTVECGGVILNLSDCSLLYEGIRTELTKNEFRILELLMTAAGHVCSRDQIMQHLWEAEQFVDDNTLTVNMTRLRHKLSELGLPEYIRTKKGIGYTIEV